MLSLRSAWRYKSSMKGFVSSSFSSRLLHTQPPSPSLLDNSTPFPPSSIPPISSSPSLSSITPSLPSSPLDPSPIVEVASNAPENLWHIQKVTDYMNLLHDDVALPWWATIVLTTITVRTLFLPFNISLLRNSARLNTIRSQVEALGSRLKSTQTDEEKQGLANEMIKLFKDNRCHPYFNIITPCLMAPMFISVFLAVERMVVYNPACQIGGTMWFLDLSLPDMTWTLPVFSGLSWLATIELGSDQPRSEYQRNIRSVMRTLAIAMIPITQSLPTGVFVYWVTSNLFSIVQILTLQRSQKLRALLGFPPKSAGPLA